MNRTSIIRAVPPTARPHRRALSDAGTPSTRPEPVANHRRTYTVAEVADIVGISRSTAYECVRRGEIPSRRFGRRIVVFHHELERMLGASGALTVQMDIEAGTTNSTA
jgi:excisionase family DNA binding protein